MVQCDAVSDDHITTEVTAKTRVELGGHNKYHIIHLKGNKICPDCTPRWQRRNCKWDGFIAIPHFIWCSRSQFQSSITWQQEKEYQHPFYPIVKSIMEAIKVQLKEKPPSQPLKAVSGMARGPAGVKSAGELPRSLKQAYDVQANSKRDLDLVEDLIVYARHKDEKAVLCHEDMPLDLWVLGTNTMCNDLVRFSSSGSLSHPINIDPTFNMGQYEVTPAVCKQLLFLRTKWYGQNPVFLGPTMLHHKKNFGIYNK